jgi:hypothetical protein
MKKLNFGSGTDIRKYWDNANEGIRMMCSFYCKKCQYGRKV